MVILLQLLIFLGAIIWRGRNLFGWKLKKIDPGSKYLRYISKGKKGKILNLQIGIMQERNVPFLNAYFLK